MRTYSQKSNELETVKQQLIAQHTTKVSVLEKSIASYTAPIYRLRQEQKVTTSSLRQAEIEDNIQRYLSGLDKKRDELNEVNRLFDISVAQIDAQISETRESLDSLSREDDGLMVDIATVEASVSITHVHWVGWLNLYVPVFPLTVIVIVVLCIYLIYLRRRRIFIP